MNNVALLTARKGSKLKDKCFLKLNGKEFINYVIEESKKTSQINEFYCSSDSEEILKLAKNENFDPIIRPPELASDEASHVDVIKHFIDQYKLKNKKIDLLIVLLGNAPIIFSEWLNEAINWIKKKPECTAVVPVYEYSDHSPYRSKLINGEGNLVNMNNLIVSEKLSTNRQLLPPTYFLCHNFWVLNIKSWQDCIPPLGHPPWDFMGLNVKPILVPKSHDIHEIEDVYICEQVLNWYEKNPKFKKIKLI